MTRWLNKLSSYDISNVDVEGCNSIDQSIEALDQQTPLETITSSGTTGTISLIPKSKAGANYNMRLWKLFLLQTFGREPSDAPLNPEVDVIWPKHASGKLGHLRLATLLKTAFTGGVEN